MIKILNENAAGVSYFPSQNAAGDWLRAVFMSGDLCVFGNDSGHYVAEYGHDPRTRDASGQPILLSKTDSGTTIGTRAHLVEVTRARFGGRCLDTLTRAQVVAVAPFYGVSIEDAGQMFDAAIYADQPGLIASAILERLAQRSELRREQDERAARLGYVVWRPAL